MKISNEGVNFDSGDLSAMSAEALAALQVQADRQQTDIETFLSAQCSYVIKSALGQFRETQSKDLREKFEKLAPEKKSEILQAVDDASVKASAAEINIGK